MKNNRKNSLRGVVSSTALVLGMLGSAVALPQGAYAQSATSRHFEIQGGDLAADLQRFSADTGIQLIYSSDLVAGKRSPGVSGNMSATQALQQLLGGTGLMARMSGNSATIVSIDDAVAPQTGERVLGAVRVEGVQGSVLAGATSVNGINGSRDVTATEGTGSYTSGALTIGSKIPLSIKDTPQTVSVLTAQRLNDQNITDFTTAMKQLPGVTLVQGNSSLENTFYSRGFPITKFQVDGGAPLSTGVQNIGQIGYFPQIDMSQYDHVELLRGADGTLNGYGDPSGTLNLVRKKPLDHEQFLFQAQAGSWSNYRLVADATSPLALKGALRGRLVMTYQKNKYFYDVAQDEKALLYGIVELDATPTTLLTAGASYTKQNSVPWLDGLPRYQNGDDLKLPRSTALMAPWSRWDFATTELFGSITQKIGDAWTAKLNITHNHQNSTRKVGSVFGAVNPLTNMGPNFRGVYSKFDNVNFSADATLAGSFDIFGQKQEIVVGASRAVSDGGNVKNYVQLINTFRNPYQPYPGGPIYCRAFGAPGVCPVGSIPTAGPPVNVFAFDPNNPIFNEPANTQPNRDFKEQAVIQTGVYMNLRLTAFDRLHLTTGLRWNKYQFKDVVETLCASATCPGGHVLGDVLSTSNGSRNGHSFTWPPSGSLSFDVTKALTAYASYTDIYQDQSNQYSKDLKPLGPITGANWEAGVKWAPRNGKLNLSIAAYRIKQHGFGDTDFSVPHQVLGPNKFCCSIVDPDQARKSNGVDVEATGEVLPGLQVAASYTHDKTKFVNGSFGAVFTTIQPENLYKLWMSYDLASLAHRGPLSGLTISGGVNGQSSAFYAGSVCLNPDVPDPVTGISDCVSFDPPDYVDFNFTVPGYAVASARLDYKFSDRWSVAVNVENIFDKRYYETVGLDPSGGNWYGSPRKFTASIYGKW